MNRCKDTAKGANCALRHNDVCLAEHWWECVEGLRKQRKKKEMSQALGNDGQWREYDDLTPEEQREWMEAMTKAAQVVEERRSGVCAPTLEENSARYELKKRFIY